MFARSAVLASTVVLVAALALPHSISAQPAPTEPAAPATGAQPNDTQPNGGPPGEAKPQEAKPLADAKPDEDVAVPRGEAIDLSAVPALTFHGETDWDDAEKALSEAINRLYAAAAKAKLELGGAPMIEYLDTSGADFRFTGYLPLKAAPSGALPAEIKSGVTPAGKAMRFVHRGSYEELEDVYSGIDDELSTQGKTMKRVIEEYVSDPTSTTPNQMQTNIYVFTE